MVNMPDGWNEDGFYVGSGSTQLPGNTTGVPQTPTDQNGNPPAPDNPPPAQNPPVEQQPAPANVTQNAREINQANITNPQLPQGGAVNPVLQEADPNLITDPNKYKLGDATKVAPVAAAPAAQVSAPSKPITETAVAQTISDRTPQATAEQGQVSQEAQVQAAQQQGLSAELKQTLDDFNAELDAIGVDSNMTVQGQYTQLMQGFDSGGVPAWASGAIKLANQRLAARGLSGSTMAGEAISTAVMQAALPIAVQDAQVFKELKLATLDKKAQGVFLRAGFIANLDATNLNNRQQAAIVNAQSFLAMDMKNLDNRQQTAIINTQARLQALMSDQSAINAAAQFNARETNQMNQYYSGLSAQVDMFNTSQANSMAQFNAGQENAINQFNAALDDGREKFNTSNSLLIDQANTAYLRNINTQNNAVINQANMVNSQNLVNISNTAMANEVQLWRDGASYIWQSGENALDRNTQIAINNTQNAEWFKRFNTEQKSSFWGGIGKFLFNVGEDVIEDWLDGGLSD